MPTETLPPAHENIGARVLYTAGSDAVSDPLIINLARPGDAIIGNTAVGPLDQSSLTLNIPALSLSLRAFARAPDTDGVWFVEHDNVPPYFAMATIHPDGGGSPTIRGEAFNVDSVTQSGPILTISWEVGTIFGVDLAQEAVPILYPRVETVADTTADYIIDSFDLVGGSVTFELGVRNKNGQFSNDNWDGTNDICYFEAQ